MEEISTSMEEIRDEVDESIETKIADVAEVIESEDALIKKDPEESLNQTEQDEKEEYLNDTDKNEKEECLNDTDKNEKEECLNDTDKNEKEECLNDTDKNEKEECLNETNKNEKEESKNPMNETDSENKPKELDKNDPYAYLQRREFTSEKFKIEIRGLPRNYGLSQLRKLLNSKLNLKAHKIKPPHYCSSWIYVCFGNEENRQSALKVINGYTWRNCLLKAECARGVPDPLVMKRRIEETEKEFLRNKRQKIREEDENLTLEEKMKNITTPLWKIPYEEQLQKKTEDMKQALREISAEIQKTHPVNLELRAWLKKQGDLYEGMPCPLDTTKASPITEAYRNNCEFTIGLNADMKEPTVGFRLSSYKGGSMTVGPVDHLCHIPLNMKNAVKVFQNLVRQSDKIPYNPETHEGYWKKLKVRTSSSTDDLMLVSTIHPQSLTDAELKEFNDTIVEYFKHGKGATCGVTSLYIEKSPKGGPDIQGVEHLLGETYIHETICGLTFRISPNSFFQINAPAAEVLYRTVGELIGVDSETTILDVCCGTGTIGLSLAKKCGHVIGIESVPQAVEDARYNARVNSINNSTFIEGKAESEMGKAIGMAAGKKVVAIVDPPRAGLHQNAIKLLRRERNIGKLVFLSCDARKAAKNFVDLGRLPSGAFKGAPFIPERAVAVDMFPHTPHCELIILFRRA